MALKTEAELHALVSRIQEALSTDAMNEIETLSNEPMGRCFLGVAGFLEHALATTVRFLKVSSPCDEDVNATERLLLTVANAVLDEDNAVHAAQLGWHNVLLKLLVHDNERITDAASGVVVNCATHNCNTSGINISFPYKTLPLEPPTRPWPLLQALPRDSRDDNDRVVLIRAVTRRMTGQPKTGYLLWGAAVILSRWIHLHRELFHGKRVLEVGSGLGLSGIVAGFHSDLTILTDYQQDTINALAYNVALNQTPNTIVTHLDWDHLDEGRGDPKVDLVIASDIICDPTTAEGFANVIRSRLSGTGVAYLVNATSHSRFGVVRLQEILLAPPFDTTIVPVEALPDGARLLDTVWDANELRYEHYTIRLQ
ncbi:hypothetical protein H310_09994 [Aphanomyces invadans]|uniref:FAM86 N-terminal domain-containing protein n=1 Tax=Aphanomyces invadans TaxID=157072 RepID=A0A024TU98_9STRA|nr:hypothetical protein H310_09994 [Aphanomyces invadans]ETV97206.1 hypothetical protein H310_09994 [Aphanomyces invadans]|eukprot:XP_008874452.1 hypothetical protein H310_09994 [Aphanomyces invadans]